MKVGVSGIYCILNIYNGKVYIGSAIDIRNRWYIHKWYLRNSKHQNIHLQRAWNKYGENAFKFSVIEIVNNKSLLIFREQIWLNYTECFKLIYGYNLVKYAGSQLGYVHTDITKEKLRSIEYTEDKRKRMSDGQKGKKHSEETKLKISKTTTGKKLSEQTKIKMSLAKKGKAAYYKKDLWPHGSTCKCDDCKGIKAMLAKQYREKIKNMAKACE